MGGAGDPPKRAVPGGWRGAKVTLKAGGVAPASRRRGFERRRVIRGLRERVNPAKLRDGAGGLCFCWGFGVGLGFFFFRLISPPCLMLAVSGEDMR